MLRSHSSRQEMNSSQTGQKKRSTRSWPQDHVSMDYAQNMKINSKKWNEPDQLTLPGNECILSWKNMIEPLEANRPTLSATIKNLVSKSRRACLEFTGMGTENRELMVSECSMLIIAMYTMLHTSPRNGLRRKEWESPQNEIYVQSRSYRLRSVCCQLLLEII